MDIAFVIINAITVAAIYGLIAIAVSITWSSLGLVNLAYGFIFSFAGYAAWLFATELSKSPFLIAAAGIVAGAVAGIIVCLLVFIPAIGAYVTPLILGGGKHLMIGALIALQFGSSRNWPLGSAQALILMVGVMIALIFYVRSSTGKAQALHG